MCICACMCNKCLCTCVYICVYVHSCINVYMSVFVCVYMYMCMCTCALYVYVCVSAYVCVVYACVYSYICGGRWMLDALHNYSLPVLLRQALPANLKFSVSAIQYSQDSQWTPRTLLPPPSKGGVINTQGHGWPLNQRWKFEVGSWSLHSKSSHPPHPTHLVSKDRSFVSDPRTVY